MRFVFFGDSICFGQCVSPHLTWVSRISAELHRKAGKQDITIINSSVNGNTTRLALERIGSDLQLQRPDIVLIQFGLNDCNCWISDEGHPRVSLHAYRANLDEIIDRARIFGTNMILLTTNHLTQQNGPVEQKQAVNAKGTYRARIIEYNDVMRQVATSTRSTLIDVEEAWINGPEQAGGEASMLAPDGLHLSPNGHDFYFEVMKPVCLNAAQQTLLVESAAS